MATMTIHNLDDELKMRVRAARHGQSMEEEACSILRAALSAQNEANAGAALIKAVRACMAPLGGVELELPPRGLAHEPIDFNGFEFHQPEYDDE